MLARQQRRRHHHRHLLAVHRRDEGGAQRHFGLAEADIAADQPVHRPAGGEIVEHRVDGRLLVLGLLIGEARGELVIEALRRRQHRRGAHLPRGGDADQLPGHVAQALLQPRLARLPGAAAELVERAPRLHPSRSATEARCSRPAGTAGRRRHRWISRQSCGAPAASIVFSPMKRPMPWSAWTTRSPAGEAGGFGDEVGGALALRFERRTSRSPRMSCSAMTASRSVSKPVSSGSTARPTCPASSFSASASVCDRLRALPSPCSTSTWPSRSREPSRPARR